MRNQNYRSWMNYTSTNNDGVLNTLHNRKSHVTGFVEMIDERVRIGWRPHFITLQFRQLPGKTKSVLDQMRIEVETLYRKLISRVQRFPRTKHGSLNVPFLLGCADLPISKRQKTSLAEVSINGGLHHHEILLLPPNSRLRTDLTTHFDQEQRLYRKDSLLSSIFTEPIDEDIERVVGYAFKGVVSGRLNYGDAVILLPRS